MKNNFLVIFLMFLSFSFVFSSCGDDEDEVTKKDLIEGRWIGETITTTGSLNGVPQDTQSDDISDTKIEFKNDGTYTSEGEDEIFAKESGKWEYTNSEKEIIFDKGTDDELTFVIDVLTKSDFKLSFSQELTQNGFTIKSKTVVDLKK